MKQSTQIVLSRAIMVGSVLIISAVFLLAWPVPKVLAIWSHAGRGLDTIGRQLTADASAVAQTYGLAILTLVLVMFLVSLVWHKRLRVGQRCEQ
jgi:type II secretory pathway component PulF